MFSFLLHPEEFYEQLLRRTLNSLSQQEGAWEMCIWGVTHESLLESIAKEYARYYGERIVMVEHEKMRLGDISTSAKGNVITHIDVGSILVPNAQKHIESSMFHDELYDACALQCGILDQDGTQIEDSSNQKKIIWKRETLSELFESDPKMIYKNDDVLLRACSVTSDRIFLEPTTLYYVCT